MLYEVITDPPYLVDYQGGNHPQSWATKPRKGVGLSTSAITNSYIKLAGTLRNNFV